VDEDSQLSHFQNFYLDTVTTLVATFEELSKDEPDPDLVSAAQCSASIAVFGQCQHQLRQTKILNWLNQNV